MLRGLVGVVVTGFVLGGAACGSGSDDGGTSGAGGKHDGGAGSGGAPESCTADLDCNASAPTTDPAGCAVGKCNLLQGTCSFVAKDADGDGHPAANCSSTAGAAVQSGDDCDDDDPDLYPGHGKACDEGTDGGTPCQTGQITCKADGTKSACAGTVVCVNQACLAAVCTGVCAPGQKQCNGNGVQSCQPDGSWDATTACSNQTCVSGICQGVCAPSQTQCSGATPQNCSSTGQWTNGQACPEACINGACAPGCVAGVKLCSGNTVHACVDGQWQETQTCPYVCVTGSCIGVCTPGATQCCKIENGVTTCGSTETSSDMVFTQICDSIGQWVQSPSCSSCGPAVSGCSICNGAATCEVKKNNACACP